jgi:hypothetical protein
LSRPRLRSDVQEVRMPRSAGMRESGGSLYTADVGSMESCLFHEGCLGPAA